MSRKYGVVTAGTLLDADVAVRTRGYRRSLRRLERGEPRLAEFVMEHGSSMYVALMRDVARRRTVRRLHRKIMTLVLVVCEAGIRRDRYAK